jgi:hypothetical protein
MDNEPEPIDVTERESNVILRYFAHTLAKAGEGQSPASTGSRIAIRDFLCQFWPYELADGDNVSLLLHFETQHLPEGESVVGYLIRQIMARCDEVCYPQPSQPAAREALYAVFKAWQVETVTEGCDMVLSLKAHRKDIWVTPPEGGCWFCKRAHAPLVFDWEFDTAVHLDCIRKALALDPEDCEAIHMAYLLEETNGSRDTETANPPGA